MRQLTLGVVALLIGVAGVLGGVTGAHAGLSSCYTDPTVTLSNGQQLTLATTVATDPANVLSVSYVLHLPPGLSIAAVSYDQYASVEHVSSVPSRGPGYFDVDITVTTSGASGIEFTSTARFLHGPGVHSTSGKTGETATIAW